MNENINLCKILDGLEGIKLYSTIYGEVTFLRVARHDEHDYPIKFEDKIQQALHSVDSKGRYLSDFPGECTLFPSKDQRDWSRFKRPIPKGTPMVCGNNKDLPWTIYDYAGKIDGTHYVEYFTNRSPKENVAFEYMIPFSKFNPKDIKESLKYNIQE